MPPRLFNETKKKKMKSSLFYAKALFKRKKKRKKKKKFSDLIKRDTIVDFMHKTL